MIFLNIIGIVSISGLGYYINIYFVNSGDIGNASWIEDWRNTAMFAVTLSTGLGGVVLELTFHCRAGHPPRTR